MPHQCPECARFLSNKLVTGLATAPAPCPKCGTTLTPELFSDSVRPPDQPAVRPPDLAPPDVRAGDDGRDVLAGWDEGEGEVVDLAAWRDEHRGLEPEAVALVAAAAGALGVAIGAALSPSSRTRGAFLGAAVAGLAAAVVASWSRR